MTQPIPHALSFVLDESRHEVDFLATPSEATSLWRRLEAIRTADLVAGHDTVQDWQVRPLTQSEPGSAVHLVDTIVEALALDEEEDAQIEALMTKAKANDALAGASGNTVGHVVDFVWDNGGGDDNCFTQAFLSASHDEGSRASAAFVDALEDWLDNEGHAYDFTFGPVQTSGPEQPMAEAVQELADELADNEDPSSLATSWAQHLRQAVTDTSPAPARRKPGVR